MKPNKYQVVIFSSEEDVLFGADVPELPGFMALGRTHEQALKSAKEAIDIRLDTAREFGHPVPEPKGRRLTPA